MIALNATAAMAEAFLCVRSACPCNHRPSPPAKAGEPVRHDPSMIISAAEYWIPGFRR
jgi:hypothetical protein